MQKLSVPSWNSGQVLGTAGAIPSDGICLRLPDLQGWSLVSSHGSGRGSQCPPLEPRVVVATLSLPQSSCRQCPVVLRAHREHSPVSAPPSPVYASQ